MVLELEQLASFIVMTSYNYYGWGAGLGFPPGPSYPYGTQGVNLSTTTGNPLPGHGPGPSVNQATAQNGVQPNFTQPSESDDEPEFVNMEVKVLCPQNKKDYHMYTLRHIARDVDSPEKLKAEIYKQCEDVVPSPQTMEIGFYLHSKKKWINNRLDMNDMWKMASNGGKVMLWCIGIGEKQKRSHDDDAPEQEPARKRPAKSTDTSVDSLKTLAKDYESQLKAKHNDAYTPFQYKLWAEMYAKGGHNSLDDPPHAAMFNRETKPQSRTAHDHAAVMVSVIDKLCSAITPKQAGHEKRTTLSPMKKAELRSTYMK